MGKTRLNLPYQSKCKKHPHERGEDPLKVRARPRAAETPPRAWGRPIATSQQVFYFRNTPTSVGKTGKHPRCSWNLRKHPHERGEDRATEQDLYLRLETPPRAWGRPSRAGPAMRAPGNTPTSVGKTHAPSRNAEAQWKHPHERGEDSWLMSTEPSSGETPPRAWGRPFFYQAAITKFRNTPTSVGKTA